MHPHQRLTAVLRSGTVRHADLTEDTEVVVAHSDYAQEAIDEARRRGRPLVFLDPAYTTAVHITTPRKPGTDTSPSATPSEPAE
jgi:hypothetical protein